MVGIEEKSEAAVPATAGAAAFCVSGRTVGAKWVPAEKLWRVRYGFIRGDRELEERVVKG